MWKLFWSSLKLLYRDKQTIFWALAFPIIFAVVFGLFDLDEPPTVRVAVVAQQRSEVSEALLSGLRRVNSFEVSRAASLPAAEQALREADQDVVLSVPAGTATAAGAPAPLQVLYNENNFTTNQFALTAIERIVDGMNLRMAGVTRPPIEVRTRGISARTVKYYDFLLPGLVAMGVMTFSIIGGAIAVARYREQRILKRILATPLRPVKFLAAQVVARVLLALVQTALILAVGVFVFNANVYGNVLWLFVLAAIANLIFLNIGFAVAGRAPNPEAASGIGNAVALPMMFLSGVFFPTDTLPAVMQTLVKYLPLTPLIEAMRKVDLDAESITATGPQLLQLAIWIVVSFLLAVRNFRFSRT